MKYDSVNDYELISMIHESSDDAKDILFEKYRYIIDIEVKKYLRACKGLGYDYNDLYQDALVGFSDAINSYRDDKKTALPSFITLCVDRKLQVSIAKAGRLKNKMINDSLSLEESYGSFSIPLRDLLSDNSQNDPLENILKEEKLEELRKEIKDKLSDSEYDVYLLMIAGLKYDEIAEVLKKDLKQVDNAMQRVKNKIRKILES
ncbi:MAG TPA: hypothetical protein DCE23_02805 [Firmicutes bacterium]|nr:hypothetical protein [Bacillota bacterium]